MLLLAGAMMVVAVGLAALPPLGADTADARRPIIGIDGGWAYWSPEETSFRRRVGIPWTRHEFTPDLLDEAPAYFEGARRAGTRTLCLLGNGQGAVPKDPEPYARWAAEFVRRYGPRAGGQCTWLEVLNEPYWKDFSGGRADPAGYARFVRAVSIATREVDPGVRILAAADTTWAGDGPDDGTPWVEPMVAAVPDLESYIDGIAVHPYTGDDPRLCSLAKRWCFNRLPEIRRRLVALGLNEPIWITEVGVSTCRSAPGCRTRAEQRAWTKDMLKKASRWPWVKAVFLYQLRDQRTGDNSSFQYGYGLFTDRGRPKPVWEVVRRYLHAGSRRR